MGTKASIAILFLFVLTLGFLRSDVSAEFKPGGHAKVHLNFWNGFTGPDGQVMLGIIRRFNDANPDVEVSMQRIDWNTYYNKLLVAALDGRGPQLFVIQSQWMTRMHRNGFIADLSEMYRGKDAIPESDFVPYVIQQVKYGNEMAGVPLDIWPFGLYYNADLFKQAGIVDANGQPQPPRTREEFLRDAKLMQHMGPGNVPDVWGYALTNWQWNFQTVLPQFDGRYLDEKGRADLANPSNVEALQFLVSLKGPPTLIPPPENELGWTGFRQKQVAMVFDGIFMVGDLLRLNDFNYRAAPMPVVGHHPGTLADSHVLCIRKGLPDDQREAAERFIRFLSNNSIDWAAAGQVPARTSARQNPAFAKMPVQYAFSKEIPYIQYPPRTPVEYELNTEVNFAVEKAIRGDATPLEALKVANANVQKYIDADNERMRREGISQ
jgi:multiple sugar transport system substrate-binding protein